MREHRFTIAVTTRHGDRCPFDTYDDLSWRTKKNNYVPINSSGVKMRFWQYCGEDDFKCKNSEHSKRTEMRADPVLKLFFNCPAMLTRNSKQCPSGTSQRHQGHSAKCQPQAWRGILYCTALKWQSSSGCLCLSSQECYSQAENPDVQPQFFEMEPMTVNFEAKIHDDFCTGDRNDATYIHGNHARYSIAICVQLGNHRTQASRQAQL